MTDTIGTFEERPKRSILSRLGVRASGSLAVAGANNEAGLVFEEGGRIGEFAISSPIATSEELTQWLADTSPHQHGDPLFLDTPPGADPELT